MNLIISAVVGGLLSSAVLFTGVNVAQGPEPTKVSQDKLYEYADQ